MTKVFLKKQTPQMDAATGQIMLDLCIRKGETEPTIKGQAPHPLMKACIQRLCNRNIFWSIREWRERQAF